MLEQPFNRVLVAHVQGDPVQHDVVGIEHVQHGEDIAVGEDVEPVLVEQDVAASPADLVSQRVAILRLWLDHQRVTQGGLRDLPLARRTPQAVRGKGGLPVGGVRDLGVLPYVVVRARHDADAVPVRVVGELLEVGNDLLGVRRVPSSAAVAAAAGVIQQLSKRNVTVVVRVRAIGIFKKAFYPQHHSRMPADRLA